MYLKKHSARLKTPPYMNSSWVNIIHCSPHHFPKYDRIVAQYGQKKYFELSLNNWGEIQKLKLEIKFKLILFYWKICIRKRRSLKNIFNNKFIKNNNNNNLILKFIYNLVEVCRWMEGRALATVSSSSRQHVPGLINKITAATA